MFGLLMAISCIKKTTEYLFTKTKVNKWHSNTMEGDCVRVDVFFVISSYLLSWVIFSRSFVLCQGGCFCYFKLFTVSGYIFKMFYMALFIGNALLKFYHRQLFIYLIQFFSYSSYKSIYFNVNMFFPVY